MKSMALLGDASGARLFLGTFAAIFVAELPDKTALATMLLAARRRPSAVFAGVAAAFAVHSAVAVAFGGLFARLPERVVRVAAGVLFLVFAVAMWRRKDEEETKSGAGGADGFWPAAAAAFAVIFVAEWGDLTQLATAALAARFGRPLTIFAASTAGLWAVAALAVLLGRGVGRAFDRRRLELGAAALFAAIGAYLLAGA
jgi:putative Ca2+/H+ antiporter (TMEM165/GDT1 family)